jgi:hypothetical protein
LGLLAAAALLGIALLVIGRRPTREQQLTRPLDVLPWRREDAEPTPAEPEPVPAPSPPPPLVKRSVAARGAPLGDAAYAPTAPFEAIADAAAALVEAQRRARAAGLAARAAAEAAQARENSPDGERDDGQARP